MRKLWMITTLSCSSSVNTTDTSLFLSRISWSSWVVEKYIYLIYNVSDNSPIHQNRKFFLQRIIEVRVCSLLSFSVSLPNVNLEFLISSVCMIVMSLRSSILTFTLLCQRVPYYFFFVSNSSKSFCADSRNHVRSWSENCENGVSDSIM